jgi:methylthioribose-1-phosphate isomerase
MSIEIPISQTPTISWNGTEVSILDQTLLPLEESYIVTNDYQVVCEAILRLSIRGAPAIGVAGAYACALAANSIKDKNVDSFLSKFRDCAKEISETRPTAVNLSWAVEKMLTCIEDSPDKVSDIQAKLLTQAHSIREDDLFRCHKLCLIGSEIITDKAEIITICNTGGLVGGGGIGSALSIIQYAHSQGKDLLVHVCETRPLLQGSRLNTWELKRTQTPFILMTDSMAAQTMKNSDVSLVIVGADRIASNGDTANKIGTYSLAVLAKHHEIPFYVAAPLSTVDYKTKCGEQIPVENRDPKELTRIRGVKITMEDIEVSTPAFDVTPSELIDGIITEKGIARPPYLQSLRNQMNH